MSSSDAALVAARFQRGLELGLVQAQLLGEGLVLGL